MQGGTIGQYFFAFDIGIHIYHSFRAGKISVHFAEIALFILPYFFNSCEYAGIIFQPFFSLIITDNEIISIEYENGAVSSRLKNATPSGTVMLAAKAMRKKPNTRRTAKRSISAGSFYCIVFLAAIGPAQGLDAGLNVVL